MKLLEKLRSGGDLGKPMGLGIDPFGSVCVMDPSLCRVQKFIPHGGD